MNALSRMESQISSALAREVQLIPRGTNHAQLMVPFYFPDGDGLVIHVRPLGQDAGQLSDQAHTLQHLAYHSDLDKLRDGTRGELFERILSRHRIEDRDGELVREWTSGEPVGAAVFSFVQALLEISDLRVLDREIVRSTFREDLHDMIAQRFPHAIIRYVDPQHDPDGRYPIPFVLNGVSRPVAIFAISTDETALAAVVTAKQHAEWGRRLRLVAVEDDQSKLSRRTVAWLSDSFDKQFASFHGNEDVIASYLAEEYETARLLDIAASA